MEIRTLIYIAQLGGAVCFVLGLHLMNSPARARNGNLLSAGGMVVAVLATLVSLVTREGGMGTVAWVIIVVGFLVGGGLGLYTARNVQMTEMPQLVSLFNAVGGGAAALVGIEEFLTHAGEIGAPVSTTVFVVLDVVIGAVTFTGSLIASGKLMGLIRGRPIVLPGARPLTVVLAVVALAGTALLVLGAAGAVSLDATVSVLILGVILASALVFGVTMVLPIGGADMPVVISLLNAFTGTAVAMAGFVLNNPVLITSGALVGAAGGILTKLMADAMNRSILNIMLGGFGGGEGTTTADAGGRGASVRSVGADDAAIQLVYASNVIIVPGYGLAVAQAQHAVRELAELLEGKGVHVVYAIHPVAGRMPGHMNVLLAEANVPYPLLKEMDDINPEFDRCDVALVVGANDVTNPAARRPGNPVSGMPILNVDHAKSIIVVKRSMGRGYAGIDNELYGNPRTGMLFADAKEGLALLISAVKAL
ncbi:MAG TPA: NAD(P)(+) transhydrogenase (Re/Si-specific) subunit beta [Patescibacteria group bacterium]|nr:NAD(P)(+) transhydrogenase (Re/Si-specific) subunit beta [Patescibacteria group bacterium]